MDLIYHQYNFLKIFDLFKAKYGAPTITQNGTVQNRMGASFTCIEYKWIGNTANIVLCEYGSKLDEGKVSIFTQDYIS